MYNTTIDIQKKLINTQCEALMLAVNNFVFTDDSLHEVVVRLGDCIKILEVLGFEK